MQTTTAAPAAFIPTNRGAAVKLEPGPPASEAAARLRAAARELGLSAEWRDIRACDADFASNERAAGRYLRALIDWGWRRAQTGAPHEGRAAVERAADLDPVDRLCARRVLVAIDRLSFAEFAAD
ncbi:MAG: hypothetical protein KGM42_18935 [Hyphomicrobiales bacterium]|nr:hypothetical protein [Hyphomicrobiales bacterium]